MDKTILNGSKLRVYDLGNSQSGSIQYTLSRLKITGNNSGSGVLISDGKLHLKSGDSTTSMAYVSSSNPGVSFNSGRIYLGTGSNTSSIYNDNGNVHIDSGITVSNLNIEYTEGVAANILGRVQFGSGVAIGDYSHALGLSTLASGDYSHALGNGTIANGNYSHALGAGAIARGEYSHTLGSGAIASGDYSHALGLNSTTGKRILAQFTIPATSFSLSILNASTYFEPGPTVVISDDGYPVCLINITNVTANAITASCSADYIDSEFYYIVANKYPYSGLGSHALGIGTQAIGGYSHALGDSTKAIGGYSHALGDSTQATGGYSHALGTDTQATGYSSHALGYRTQASGAGSHALGSGSVATGYFSHALGLGTTTSISYQHATGKYNAVDNNAIFIVGVGDSDTARANGFWVTLTGLANAGLGFSSSGYLKIGGQSTMSNALVRRLQVGSLDSGAGKYHQLIGEDYTEFVIHSTPQGGNVIRIDGSEQSILIDEVNAFNVGIGMSLPQYKLDVNGVIRSSEGFTSSGYLKIGGQSTMSNVLVKDKLYISGSAGTASMYMNAQSRLLISNTIYGKSGLYVDGQMTGNQGLYVFDNEDPLIMAYFDGFYGMVDICNTSINPSQILIGNQNLGSFTEIPSELYIGNNAYFTSLLQNNSGFVSGFGGFGWLISQANKSVAQFDDLWIRGSMNVYLMVINQIRSTNGSLWISDASKATSASYSSATNTLILSFLTGSLVPFIAGDILRSKRWGLSGSTTQSQWDITTTVSSVNYASGYVTLSAPTINNLYTVTGSANGTWIQLAERLSNSGSLWVRVGNTTTESNRDGSIYITSNDLGGPFLDVYDLVTSSVEATSGTSNSVNQTKTKVRLGQLSGIVDSTFGGALSGYGLYADNVYLKGAINAQHGIIGGWTIYPQQLQYVLNDVKEVNLYPDGLSFVDLTTYDSLYIGYSNYVNGFGVFCGNLLLTLNTKFRVDASGAYLSGSITASAGYIGGWDILNTELSSGDDWTTKTILSPNSLIFSDLSQGAAIIIGTHSQLSSYGIVCGYPTGDPSDLYIDPIYFKVDVGGAYLQGEVLAESGNIGGWDIATTNISKGNIILSATDNHTSLLISSTDYTTSNGVYLGSSSTFGTRMSVMNGSNKFLFDGTNIGISTSKFTLSQGVITAQDAIISGSIQANTGYIGGASGWSITTNKITSSNGILFSNSSTPAIKIGAASYGSNGIWLGKGNYYSASFWNSTLARGLKWDGLKVIISASNFNLDSSGNIYASNATISGSISSSAGYIGGWLIGQNTLAQDDSILLGSSSTVDPTDIFMGSNNGLPYFQLGSQFKYTNSNIIMSGSIQANTGYIGGSSGWVITSNKISHSSGIEFSASTTPAIKMSATGYGTNGIWFGKGASNYSASFWSSTNQGLKWDGTNLTISSSNFTLSSAGNISASNAVIGGTVYANQGNFNGSITASTGLLGGWSIDSNGISADHSNGTISVTKLGSDPLILTDVFGNFTYSADNNELFSITLSSYPQVGDSTLLQWRRTGSAGSSTYLKDSGLIFTCSTLVSKLIILKADSAPFSPIPNVNYLITAKVSQYLTIVSSPPLNSTILLGVFTSSTFNEDSRIYLTLLELYLSGYSRRLRGEVQYQFLFTLSVTKPLYFGLIHKCAMRPVSPDGVYGVTFSDFKISRFTQYTLLSDKGLLVFNDPSNYIQLSSAPGTNSSNLSVGNITVLNLTVKNLNATADQIYKNVPLMCNVNITTSNGLWNIYKSQIIESLGIDSSFNILAPINASFYKINSTELEYFPMGLAGHVIYTYSNTPYLEHMLGADLEGPATYSVNITCRIV